MMSFLYDLSDEVDSGKRLADGPPFTLSLVLSPPDCWEIDPAADSAQQPPRLTRSASPDTLKNRKGSWNRG